MRLFLLIVCLATVHQIGFSQTKVQKKLASLEQQRFEAMTTKNTSFLGEILSEDLTYIHSNGLFETKTDHIANIRSGLLVYKSMQPEDRQIKVYRKSAVITGLIKVTGVLKEKEFNIRLRYTDVYVKKKGKWQLVAWQSVKVD